jgi:hypothetical protein
MSQDLTPSRGALMQRIARMDLQELVHRVIFLEGFVKGLTGKSAPETTS